MKFRPCIDLRNGKVTQIVGASLTDDGRSTQTNFVAAQSPAYYASMYLRDGLAGGHVIMLGPGNADAAKEALAAAPGFLQVGGGITPENAAEWLAAGASHVIVTSYLFQNGDFSPERLEALAAVVPREKLVIDLSCRETESGYVVACDRWQHLTSLKVCRQTFDMLGKYCCEFLIHAVAVEGRQQGIDAKLVSLLAAECDYPVTYAGGIHTPADIDLIGSAGSNRIDFTVGSALDIFGGTALRYEELKHTGEAELLPEYRHCELCPRKCGVNRQAGQRGFCNEGAKFHVASMGAHFGEEPPLVGQDGSGTIFLTGCSCGCFFCQNYQLSQEHLGEYLTIDSAVSRILKLADSGVRNLNLVTPDHFWPHLREIVKRVKAAGCQLPWIWNSSGFTRVEILEEAAELVDIFLPDFKFADPELAHRCMGRRDYPEVALAALDFLVDRVGFLRPFDDEGVMAASCGVLVRHLVLPGEVDNSLQVLDLLAERYGNRLPISVMRQFRPMPECQRRGQLTRMVTDDEYQAVVERVNQLGFRKVFIQPDSGDENFVPDFRNNRAPFKGNERGSVSGV